MQSTLKQFRKKKLHTCTHETETEKDPVSEHAREMIKQKANVAKMSKIDGF